MLASVSSAARTRCSQPLQRCSQENLRAARCSQLLLTVCGGMARWSLAPINGNDLLGYVAERDGMKLRSQKIVSIEWGKRPTGHPPANCEQHLRAARCSQVLLLILASSAVTAASSGCEQRCSHLRALLHREAKSCEQRVVSSRRVEMTSPKERQLGRRAGFSLWAK